mmetsp:Transcript_79838/g.229188  ORF Transcript_79838/g.229188 Transcript_79838/m.229188 type:complete len:298 (-) Transcript_79838:277-1170(-)
MDRRLSVNCLFFPFTCTTTKLERASPFCSIHLGTPLQLRRESSPQRVAPTSTNKPMRQVRTILPSRSEPVCKSPAGVRGGGPLGSPRLGPSSSGLSGDRRPPSNPSDSARGTILRLPAMAPSGFVKAKRRPSECARAPRQHSRYSEIDRGIINRACDSVRRRPLGSCSSGLLGGPGDLDATQASKEVGSDNKRTKDENAALLKKTAARARTPSEGERPALTYLWTAISSGRGSCSASLLSSDGAELAAMPMLLAEAGPLPAAADTPPGRRRGGPSALASSSSSSPASEVFSSSSSSL